MKIIRNLTLHATSLAMNYILTAAIVAVADIEVAGACFWFLNLQALLGLVIGWGAESWYVRGSAIATPGGRNALKDECATVMTGVFLALSIPIGSYLLFIEGMTATFVVLFLLLTGANSATNFHSYGLEGQGKSGLAILMRSGAPYLISGPVIGIFALSKRTLELNHIFCAVLISSTACMLAAKYANHNDEAPTLLAWRKFPRLIVDQAPNLTASLLGFVFAWQLLFISRATLSFSEIATLAYSMKLASVISVPMMAIGIMYSRPLAKAETRPEVTKIYRRSIATSILMGAPIATGVLIGGTKITSLLNASYDVEPQLQILAAGQLILMLFGAQSTLLAMRGGINGLNIALAQSILISAPIIYLAAKSYGVAGASCAVAASMVFRGVATQIQVRTTEQRNKL